MTDILDPNQVSERDLLLLTNLELKAKIAMFEHQVQSLNLFIAHKCLEGDVISLQDGTITRVQESSDRLNSLAANEVK